MATSTNESDLHAESDLEESATNPKSPKKKELQEHTITTVNMII